MRLMTFEHDGKAKVGALDGELVIDLRATRPGVPASMRELLEGGAAAMRNLSSGVRHLVMRI